MSAVKKEIEVATYFGTRRVEATLTAHMAVHRGVETNKWVLSHLASGCAMMKFDTKRQALTVANTLERECASVLAELARMKLATKPSPATRGKWKAAGAQLKAALAKAVQS